MACAEGDRPTKKILSPKPHILDSNGAWYSSFWWEVPKNHINLKILVSKFVPQGPRGVPHLGPRGAALWDLKGCPDSRSVRRPLRSHGAAPEVHALPLEVLASPLKVPWRRPTRSVHRSSMSMCHPSRSHGAAPQSPRCCTPEGPRGQTFRPKVSSLGCF